MGSGVTWFGMGTQDRVESIEVIGPRGGRVAKFSATAGGLRLGDFARKSEAICAVESAIVERRTFPCGDGVAVLSEDWTAQNWIYCSVAIKGQDVLNLSRPRAIGDSFWTVSNRAGEVVLQNRFKPALATIAKLAERANRMSLDEMEKADEESKPDYRTRVVIKQRGDLPAWEILDSNGVWHGPASLFYSVESAQKWIDHNPNYIIVESF